MAALEKASEVLDPKTKRAQENEMLSQMLKPVRGRLWLGRILGGAAGVASLAPYIALVHLGDVLVRAALAGTAPDEGTVHSAIGFVLGGAGLQMLLTFTALLVTHFADVELTRVLRARIVNRIAGIRLSWFSSTSSGRIRKAVQDDTKTLHQLVAHAPVESAMAIVTPLALLVYAFVVDWRLGLLAFASVPVYLIVQMVTMRGMGEKTAEMDSRLSDVSSTAVEFADGIAVIKAFGRTGRAHARYTEASNAFSAFYTGWVGPMLRASAIGEALVSVPVLIVLNICVGSALVSATEVTPADVIVTTLIALVLPNTIQIIGRTMWAYQIAGSSAKRLGDLLATDILDTDPGALPGTAPVAAVDDVPAIAFDDVSYSYTGTVNALDRVSLEVPKGSVTALIGPSGSGKSTLAVLAARFMDPDTGRVLIGGRDVRTFGTAELYSQVAFVLQNPQLLRLSLRENIRLARPAADDDAVWAAAERAFIAEEIRDLPDSLDTIWGEGVRLSGGQEQRIAIARAILADAPILVLDEATAATDPDSEDEIQRALSQLVRGRTVLVIAHRSESVIGSDRVVLMRSGRIDTVFESPDEEQLHRIMDDRDIGRPGRLGESIATITEGQGNDD
ncbi:ABC transporter ATP-binding protein/permease [Brevibacterium sediminis]|uniref:ABC transporter ATP-binding protein n=1 Tax=Brevibacterium sediminis TaxID=1857024 RepID=UPI0021753916|nr:ABC transporter ATP-binding protein [Brevibacterium sediminis]MCS4592283.1 ABC transporter ATP-binding protein/permease [Brevibacterium sediminis]